MQIMRFFILSLLILLVGQTVFAARQSIFVAPQTTDPNISTNLNNHYVSIDTAVPAKNQLFLFLPGTGGVAFNYLEINKTAADLGFHSINLTYPNDDAVNTICGGLNTDLDCYGNVRLEVLGGTDRSILVNVNRANSIENRLIKLLIYLQNQRPTENWNQFLINGTTIDWSRIIISGHSQGGGHAGLIGRYHSVVRVVMFAAMDFNGLANSPANWIALPNTTPNATAPDRFWGFAHQRDEMVNFNILSARVWTAYGMTNFGSIVNVDIAIPPYGSTHSLTSNIECTNFHGCIAVDIRLVSQNGIPVYKPVWEYLLSNTVSPLSVSSLEFSRNNGQSVNRPPVGSTTKLYRLAVRGTGFESTAKVFVNGIETETEFINAGEVRTKLPAGKIGRTGGSTVQVRSPNGQISNVLNF